MSKTHNEEEPRSVLLDFKRDYPMFYYAIAIWTTIFFGSALCGVVYVLFNMFWGYLFNV